MASTTPPRPAAGRGLFYSRDSGGQHDQTPAQYVRWAATQANQLGVAFDGTPEAIEQLIASSRPNRGDLYFDNCVSGKQMSRPALDALKAEIQRDRTVSHVFIPRRNRLARPDDALDGILLEKELREAGATLVFMNVTLPPLLRGRRQDISESISAIVEYDASGRFRDELAEKMIYAQLQLASRGFTTGGRAPFGFRRYLISGEGAIVRSLEDGEIVRQKGHHVVWLPGPEEELALIRRILKMLKTIPASRVAKILNSEGIPSPDAGRRRKDNGVTHPVSGQWHGTMVTNVALNPLIQAMTSYGRRSMGDRRRVSVEGPRLMEEEDYRGDSKPKVVQNPESERTVGRAHCEPLIPLEESEELLAILKTRAGTQKGKPRSRDPEKNPLGGRIYDLACRWPMYRTPYSQTFRYTCGLYQQSHGETCNYNHIDGPAATRYGLAAVRQLLLKSSSLERIAAKLQRLANVESQTPSRIEEELAARIAQRDGLEADLRIAAGNLLLAKTTVFDVLQTAVEELKLRIAKLNQEIERLERDNHQQAVPKDLVQAALSHIGNLPALADDPSNLGAAGQLFQRINLQLFLRFEQVQRGKRILNVLSGGLLTTGNAPAPIEKYAGLTNRREVKRQVAENEERPAETSAGRKIPPDSGQKAKSLGNVNRDDRI